MKQVVNNIIILFLFIQLSCSKNPLFPEDVVFFFEFLTETRPNSIVIDGEYGSVYISNCRSSKSNDNRKVQKFNLKGELLSTVVDFVHNEDGNYPRYNPLDLTLDAGHNLYILVKPYFKFENDDYWSPHNGFCIMKYDSEGYFQKEYDFAEFDMERSPVAIANNDDFLCITNSFVMIKINKGNGQSIQHPLPTRTEGNSAWPEILTSDMEIDTDENFWFVGQAAFDNQSVSCHITKMDPDCQNWFTFYSKGNTSHFGANLNNPGMAFDIRGNIYLATCYCKGLEIFHRSGMHLYDVAIHIEDRDRILPIDVAVGPDNRIYVLDGGYDLVYVFKRY